MIQNIQLHKSESYFKYHSESEFWCYMTVRFFGIIVVQLQLLNTNKHIEYKLLEDNSFILYPNKKTTMEATKTCGG